MFAAFAGRLQLATYRFWLLAPLVIGVTIAVYTVTGSAALAVALNIAFNAFQGAVAAWGFKVLRAAVPDPRAASLRAYFLLSVGLYLLAIAYATLGQLVASAALPAALLVSLKTKTFVEAEQQSALVVLPSSSWRTPGSGGWWS